MCRFLAYKGRPVALHDLVIKPSHSLLKQSYDSKERKEPLNGDGFGLGWYDHRIDNIPALYKEITPAWSNQNLLEISSKLLSGLAFAHVRAATDGLAVNELNCHPFKYKNFLWMHNGKVQGFQKHRRDFTNKILDPYYEYIRGNTDSEYAFGLFLSFLDPDNNQVNAQSMLKAFEKTIHEILDITKYETGHSSLNFAVTDGEVMLFSRFTNNPNGLPPTLYYAKGADIEFKDDRVDILKDNEKPSFYMVASEAVNYQKELWTEITPNHIVLIDKDNVLTEIPIEIKE